MTTDCPACHSSRTRPAFRAAGTSIRRCRACGSLFDTEPPDAQQLRALYEGREYFVKDGADSAGGETLWGYADDYIADRENVETKFERVLGHLERYVEPGRLLDVGSGPGFLLTVSERRRWSATGLDLNEWAAEYGRDELGVDVRVGDLAGSDFREGEFDAATMMDLIEHVLDPDGLIADAARVVRPGGALVVLTPDAASPLSRALGRRWPEVRRPGEHAVLFSVSGLAALLARHGFAACGWHSIGKIASVATLAADVAPVAPEWTARFRDWIADRPTGQRTIDFDPHTKFCLYARRLPNPQRPPGHRPARIPKRPERLAKVESAILEELESLGSATRFCDWMFEQFAGHVRGAVAEVGAGIGTFSQRMLASDPTRLLLIEPDPACATVLERRLGSDPRVRLVREKLPGAPSLTGAGGEFDLVVCQNVLEHIGDDEAAVETMARALRQGGRLALVVPAEPRLYGPLDEAYGHWRRYTAGDVVSVMANAGLEVEVVRPMNALGVPGWWAKNRRPGARIGAGSLRAYDALLAAWRPIEERLRPSIGLSLVCIARKPAS